MVFMVYPVCSDCSDQPDNFNIVCGIHGVHGDELPDAFSSTCDAGVDCHGSIAEEYGLADNGNTM